MNRTEAKIHITDILLGVLLFTFILSFSVVFVLNFRPLYYWNVKNLNLSEITGISEDLILKNYNILIDYNSIFFQKDLIFIGLPMSSGAAIHFLEVKNIFGFIQYFCIFSFLCSILLGLAKVKRKQFQFLFVAFILSFLVPLIVGLIVIWNWDSFFLTFHKLLFSGNNFWIFDPTTDPIIDILPDTFFMQCAIFIIILIFVLGVLCLITYLLLRKYQNTLHIKNTQEEK